jgi:hypothetical protein
VSEVWPESSLKNVEGTMKCLFCFFTHIEQLQLKSQSIQYPLYFMTLETRISPGSRFCACLTFSSNSKEASVLISIPAIDSLNVL